MCPHALFSQARSQLMLAAYKDTKHVFDNALCSNINCTNVVLCDSMY